MRPYVLLGSELKRRGHEVTIVAFGKFEQMAQDAGLSFSPLAGDVMELMERIMKVRSERRCLSPSGGEGAGKDRPGAAERSAAGL